jgi:Inositol hexakisphosphate
MLQNWFHQTNPHRATGITTAVVESMEQSFKQDVLRELRAGCGRILLHDEVEERPGVFSIIPLWETVSEDDILTPRDVMELVAKEGYKVGSTGLLLWVTDIFRQINYGRVAIASDAFLIVMTVVNLWSLQTDEQAPLPDALSQLLERVRTGMSQAGDFIFNCQMGRGRTTTGMVTACLISSTVTHDWDNDEQEISAKPYEPATEFYDTMDGPSEEEAYLQGMSFPHVR